MSNLRDYETQGGQSSAEIALERLKSMQLVDKVVAEAGVPGLGSFTHMFYGVNCTEQEHNYLVNAYKGVKDMHKGEIESSLEFFRIKHKDPELAKPLGAIGITGSKGPLGPHGEPEYTGGSSSYYLVHVANPTTEGTAPYTAECNDIIEALGMNYAEGNVFKAIWRRRAAELGKLKKGYDNGLYDAEKIEFFGHRLVAQSKAKQESK